VGQADTDEHGRSFAPSFGRSFRLRREATAGQDGEQAGLFRLMAVSV